MKAVRDDLILIVMSATLDAEPIAKFLGDCPIIRADANAVLRPPRCRAIPGISMKAES